MTKTVSKRNALRLIGPANCHVPKAQTERVLKNLSAILAAAGSSMDRVVRTTVFLKNISDFPAMNELYGKSFTGTPPSRTTVQVAGLPKDSLLEIDVVALQ